MVSLEFFNWHNPSGPHYGPGVDSASNTNEYQEYFLGGKGGRCVGLTTAPLLRSGALTSWNPQGLSRPVMKLLYIYTSQKELIKINSQYPANYKYVLTF